MRFPSQRLQHVGRPGPVRVAAGDRRVAFAQAIAEPELERVHAQFARDVVDVNLPGGTKVPIKAVGNQPPPPNKPPDFFQPNQKISVTGSISEPKAVQGGQTWLLPAVQAWSPDGQKTITAFKMPKQLAPGPAQLSYTGADGKPQQVQGTVFKIIRAFLDRSQLHSNQGATFEYDVQFADLGAEYLFGFAAFDNAQVRHAYH